MVANQLKPVSKNARKKTLMNLKEDIFLKRHNTKNKVSAPNIKETITICLENKTISYKRLYFEYL
jgi:hypothetical protein